MQGERALRRTEVTLGIMPAHGERTWPRAVGERRAKGDHSEGRPIHRSRRLMMGGWSTALCSRGIVDEGDRKGRGLADNARSRSARQARDPFRSQMDSASGMMLEMRL